METYEDNNLLNVDDYAENEDEILDIAEYDITATPNDFNVMTLNSFIESGAVIIPGFQRNFVWDIGRSSKLIESLLLGLPVPQLFLYEQERNKFLVIDGQQRLMSIYYFMKKRFPKKEKRSALRNIFDREGKIPEEVLHDDEYFTPFNLKLPSQLSDKKNKFHGMNYSTLGEFKLQLDLRPIRNIIVKQNAPSNDNSSMFEVFNRLNTGGMNLKAQEIRTSMYHSDFYKMLIKINNNSNWRNLLGSPEPDLHMKDIEILLRSFAMLIDSENYRPSMTRFLNQFSEKCSKYSNEYNKYLLDLFNSFITACRDLDPKICRSRSRGNLFNVGIFEAIFYAVAKKFFSPDENKLIEGFIEENSIKKLAEDKEFSEALLKGTAHATKVAKRLEKAKQIISLKV